MLGGWLTGGSPVAATATLDHLLSDLQIIPLGDQTPSPFRLEALDGRQIALADLRGRAALLYFWESS